MGFTRRPKRHRVNPPTVAAAGHFVILIVEWRHHPIGKRGRGALTGATPVLVRMFLICPYQFALLDAWIEKRRNYYTPPQAIRQVWSERWGLSDESPLASQRFRGWGPLDADGALFFRDFVRT
jgi:hypothetical protein